MVVRGLDGYRISLSLEDALQPDVMLAVLFWRGG